MLLDVDYVEPCRDSQSRQFDQHPYILDKPFHEVPALVQFVNTIKQRHKKQPKQQEKMGEITKAERDLMDLISLYPFTPCAVLWKQIGAVSKSVQINARKNLEQLEYVDFVDARVGSTNQLFAWLASMGYAFVGKKVVTCLYRGGMEHSFYIDFIRCCGIKREYKVYPEWLVPPPKLHPVDMAWFFNNQWHCFEVICTSKRTIISHLEKCFLSSDQVATVTLVALLNPSSTVVEKISFF